VIVAKDPALLDVTWRQVAAAVDELIVLEHGEQAELARQGLRVEHLLEAPLECVLEDPAGGPPLVLTGTPDRVDVRRRGATAVGVRVLDYKMSRDGRRYEALLDPRRELGKTGFQIPAYLLGALAAIPDLAPDARLEGGYLVLLHADKKRCVRPFSRALLGAGEAAGGGALVITERIRDLVARASQGRFDVDPEVACDPLCPYRPVCRYQRPPLEEEGGLA